MMRVRFKILLMFLCSAPLAVSSSIKNIELQDLYFGEVLYYAYQDLHFEALTRLDVELSQYHQLDEPELDAFHQHLGHAEFSVGKIEMQYRMTQRAVSAIQTVLDNGVDQATRNQAALALARVFHKKNNPKKSLYVLRLIDEHVETFSNRDNMQPESVRGKMSETFKADVIYLRAMALIDTGQYDKAVNDLKLIKNENSLSGFVLYNLGIALILNGQEKSGIDVLDELGRMDFRDSGLLALKDKTNLKIGYHYLEKGEPKQAQEYFERVRLNGPFSNRALLGAGWVAVSQARYDRALVPWSMLHQRDRTDHSVQEALMAVPYAYGRLHAYGRSANLYAHAMDVFAGEIIRLDDSIKSIRKGRLLSALLNENINKNKDWLVNLRKLPDLPETRYLLSLMASNDFQQAYKNYHDLAALYHHLAKGLSDLIVYEEMIELRRAYHQPLLPAIEKEFKKLDARIKLRLEQRNNLASKIKNMLISPRPEHLATSTERRVLDRITAMEVFSITSPQLVDVSSMQRIKRLRGVLLWRLQSEYDQRLTDVYNNLASLDEVIKKLKAGHHSLIRTRQAATQSYEGYTVPIRQLRTRLLAAQGKLDGVMARQGSMLESKAVSVLDKRRLRLEDYQVKARFALAESYDRATQAQLEAHITKQRKISLDIEKRRTVSEIENSQTVEINDSVEKPLVDIVPVKENVLSR